MTDMQTQECNVCGSHLLGVSQREVLWSNGHIDQVEELRCFRCNNLVYGRIGDSVDDSIIEAARRLFGKKKIKQR